jgi:hypothetical protein
MGRLKKLLALEEISTEEESKDKALFEILLPKWKDKLMKKRTRLVKDMTKLECAIQLRANRKAQGASNETERLKYLDVHLRKNRYLQGLIACIDRLDKQCLEIHAKVQKISAL